MDVHSDVESDVVFTEVRPKQAALDIKLQVIKAVQIQEGICKWQTFCTLSSCRSLKCA